MMFKRAFSFIKHHSLPRRMLLYGTAAIHQLANTFNKTATQQPSSAKHMMCRHTRSMRFMPTGERYAAAQPAAGEVLKDVPACLCWA
jgi:hypothetical protein